MNRERIARLEKEYLDEHPGTAGTVEPFVFATPAALEAERGRFPFPVITEVLLSDEWEATDKTWFVDSSGFGSAGEPALTIDQFRKQLVEYVQENFTHGFGLSGVGQFQVYVTAYRPVR